MTNSGLPNSNPCGNTRAFKSNQTTRIIFVNLRFAPVKRLYVTSSSVHNSRIAGPYEQVLGEKVSAMGRWPRAMGPILQ